MKDHELARRMSDVGFTTTTTNDATDERAIVLTHSQYYPTILATTRAASHAGIHHDDCFRMTRQVLDQIADTEPESIDRFDDFEGLGDSDTWPLVQWLARNYQTANLYRQMIGSWGAGEYLDDIARAAQAVGYQIVAGAIMNNWPVVDEEGNVK